MNTKTQSSAGGSSSLPAPFNTATKLVAVAGGSCSGKTTLAQTLEKHFGATKACLLFQDDYYIDQSHRFKKDGDVNFDHPSALEFSLLKTHLLRLRNQESIECPQYDFSTHKRKASTTTVHAKPWIFVDGTLLLHSQELTGVWDYSIFVECEEQLRLQRRLERDTRERGREAPGVLHQFETQVAPMHNLFVEPSKARANLVISGINVAQELSAVLSALGET